MNLITLNALMLMLMSTILAERGLESLRRRADGLERNLQTGIGQELIFYISLKHVCTGYYNCTAWTNREEEFPPFVAETIVQQ